MNQLMKTYLFKAEDPEAYKKTAENGLALMFSATVGGQTHRPDIKLPYHSTIKFFDVDRDNPQDIHETAKELNMVPPDPRHTKIEPGILKDRFGNDVHVIKLYGPHVNKMHEHHENFSHLGHKENYEYQPHISVDKPTWDKVVASKATTAHEAGINFGPAALHRGHEKLASYPHDQQQLAASENIKKGFVSHIAAALGIAGALAGSPQASAGDKNSQQYSSNKMLNTISSVESSQGMQTKHKKLGGIHQGESAYGKYALTPLVIRETIHMHPDLRNKHGKAMALKGDALHRYMQDNPKLEDVIAKRHLHRLEHHFGKNPEKLGFAWNQGIKGTYHAIRNKQDISNHWHVLKIKDAYSKGNK